ncbi:hypothetical protein [Mucilaginibacter oryzae]|uniref:hypothetical protein n=1 Tax=Mucilaginibacter oryzae TaxID=468058 RepID=UPI000D6CF709|nr:hypothetical protein [Mucilaginibacter oryzae]
MLILFLFIAVIPFAVTGIMTQTGYFSSIAPASKNRSYLLSVVISATLFYLPLLTSERFYFLWLFWAGLFLSIAYFVAWRNKQELQTNTISRWLGALFLLSILAGCFVILYQQRGEL